ncbi:Uncharacterised protein [Mycobacteroides abscessus subsp. massiliense]|nr:Uncharacterised protein [Mycobacteroides abscessus subsp. massiliense]
MKTSMDLEYGDSLPRKRPASSLIHNYIRNILSDNRIHVIFSPAYLSSACNERSRPDPYCLNPPNGVCALSTSTLLTDTRRKSLVQTETTSPYALSLAALIAMSSSLEARNDIAACQSVLPRRRRGHWMHAYGVCGKQTPRLSSWSVALAKIARDFRTPFPWIPTCLRLTSSSHVPASICAARKSPSLN